MNSKSLAAALIKWPGGKSSEARILLPLIPKFTGRLIDPFVGGGSTYFSVNPQLGAINDLSTELISLYRFVKDGNAGFLKALRDLSNLRDSLAHLTAEKPHSLQKLFETYSKGRMKISDFQKSITIWAEDQEGIIQSLAYDGISPEVLKTEIIENVTRKLQRLNELNTSNSAWKLKDAPANIKTAIHSAFYMYLRYLYNNIKKLAMPEDQLIAIFYYMREFCYSSMFRFNNNGHFNVPYGGMAYNRKNLNAKIDNLVTCREYLRNTEIFNLDFEKFIYKVQPTKHDFLFLDPPYDSDFSSYDRNPFDQADHIRLANLLKQTSASFLLVIKNTAFVADLYGSIRGTRTTVFDKIYAVSFQNRNDKNAEHVVFVNYKLTDAPVQLFLQ